MRRLLAGALLALSACANAEDPLRAPDPLDAELGQAFVLAVGGEARLDEGRLVLRLSAVPTDDRCATDVQCPWEGNAEVSLRAALEAGVREIHLETHQEREAAVDVYVVRLLSLDPEPVSTRKTEQEEYRATLLVERARAGG